MERLRTVRAHLKEQIEAASATQAKYYNRHHKDLQFEEKSYVLVNVKNIKVKRPCKKFTARYLSPFQIIEKKSSHAYKLRLPPSMQRLHPVFHVSMLEPYRGRTPSDAKEIREGDLALEDDRFKIEAIIDYNDKTKLYECKWTGYPDNKNTQEPLSKLDSCEAMLKEF